MLLNILIGALLMLLTAAIHAGGMMFTLHWLRKPGGRLRQLLRRMHAYAVGEVVLVMFYVSLLEVLLWAVTYLALDAIQGLERSFYFSMVTFTTLGYGEIVLDENWRLLSAFEAANGIIMFGWTTAIVIAAVQHAYFKEKS